MGKRWARRDARTDDGKRLDACYGRTLKRLTAYEDEKIRAAVASPYAVAS